MSILVIPSNAGVVAHGCTVYRPISGMECHLSVTSLTTLSENFDSIRYGLNKFQRDNPDAQLRHYQPSQRYALKSRMKH